MVTPTPDQPRPADRSGREAHFTAIYDLYSSAVTAYALRRTGVGDASDVVAETFLVAWRRLDDVPAEPETRAWLLGVARRVAANQARGDRRRSELGRKLSARLVHRFDEQPPIERLDRYGSLGTALAQLSDDDRELLMLVAWDGMTPTEVATVMGLSPPVVRKRLFRARKRLTARRERAERERVESERATRRGATAARSCRPTDPRGRWDEAGRSRRARPRRPRRPESGAGGGSEGPRSPGGPRRPSVADHARRSDRRHPPRSAPARHRFDGVGLPASLRARTAFVGAIAATCAVLIGVNVGVGDASHDGDQAAFDGGGPAPDRAEPESTGVTSHRSRCPSHRTSTPPSPPSPAANFEAHALCDANAVVVLPGLLDVFLRNAATWAGTRHVRQLDAEFSRETSRGRRCRPAAAARRTRRCCVSSRRSTRLGRASTGGFGSVMLCVERGGVERARAVW